VNKWKLCGGSTAEGKVLFYGQGYTKHLEHQQNWGGKKKQEGLTVDGFEQKGG